MSSDRTLRGLEGVVSAEILRTAAHVSQRLAGLGVPHALIGGLAVGVHGHPRATKDVDFLVGKEAFAATHPVLVYRDELSDLVRLGAVDLLAVPLARPDLSRVLGLPGSDEIPVIPVEALILMKVDAHRPQDRADVVALLRSGIELGEIRSFLQVHAPDLVARFGALVGEAF